MLGLQLDTFREVRYSHSLLMVHPPTMAPDVLLDILVLFDWEAIRPAKSAFVRSSVPDVLEWLHPSGLLGPGKSDSPAAFFTTLL